MITLFSTLFHTSFNTSLISCLSCLLILNQLLPKFAAKNVANEKQCQKAKKRPALTRQHLTLFQRFFVQSAMKIIIYCVIDQPSLAQSWSLGWRSVLNFKFSYLAFLRLMTCPMNIAQKMCKKKIFQLQSMSKVKLCVDNCFAVKNSSASWLISSIPKMKPSKQNQFKFASYNDPFTVFLSRSMNLWLAIQISKWVKLDGFESSRVLKFSGFLALRFGPGARRWPSGLEFGHFEHSGTWSWTRGHVQAWCRGSDYSYCLA